MKIDICSDSTALADEEQGPTKYGIATDGTIIAAQVTLATDGPLESKRLALKSCGLEPANHLILFCPTDKEEMKDGILMVPIQEIFNRFTATPLGQLWLRESA